MALPVHDDHQETHLAETDREEVAPAAGVDPPRSGPPAVRHAVLRLFAAARQAAGTGRAEVSGATVGDVLVWARAEFGPDFAAVLDASRVWCNGVPCEPGTLLADGDEVAVLPPVSGGS
jgi:molybdopterin synthase sulfur carrier subunit